MNERYHKYLGKYYKGDKPCIQAYEDILEQELGIKLNLPRDSSWDRAVEMRRRLSEFFVMTVRPVTADLVLLEKRSVAFHVGFLVVCEGRDFLIHAYKKAPTRLDRLSYLLDDIQGFTLNGYYRCRRQAYPRS